MGRVCLVVAALTAIACGEGSDAIDGIAADDGVGRIDGSRRPDGPNELAVYQGGSRIKMRVGTTEDGAKTFLGWRDTMRDEDCSFVRAAGPGCYAWRPTQNALLAQVRARP